MRRIGRSLAETCRIVDARLFEGRAKRNRDLLRDLASCLSQRERGRPASRNCQILNTRNLGRDQYHLQDPCREMNPRKRAAASTGILDKATFCKSNQIKRRIRAVDDGFFQQYGSAIFPGVTIR